MKNIPMGVSKQMSFRESFRHLFSTYNNFYFFVIIIYCGMASPITQNLRGYSGHILGFLLPLVLSVFFIVKNNVRLTKKAFFLLGGYLVWFVIQHFKFGSSNLSLTFFMFYQLAIAYSLVYVFRERLLEIFENAIYVLACICLVAWGVKMCIPSFFDLFSFLSLPTSSNIIKYNFLLFSVLDEFVDTGTLSRNPGFLWEAGVYSCYLCVAIWANFFINNFKKNKRLYILIVSLITTFSTTGYAVFMLSLIPLYLLNHNYKYFAKALFIIIPLGCLLMQLDFMGEKILDLQTDEYRRDEIIKTIDFETQRGNAYVYVPQRFDGLAFEGMNVLNDPIVGYGIHTENSYTHKVFGEYLALSNGLVKLYAQYGIVFGGILTLLYLFSFKMLFKSYRYKGHMFVFLLYLFISISYPFYNIPVILGFLFYGLLPFNDSKINLCAKKI